MQTYTASELPIILNPPGPVRGYRFVNWSNTAGQVVTVIPAGTKGILFSMQGGLQLVICYNPLLMFD
ncbi:hypothetical protein LCM23_09285 [Cytobacillus kochii]|uniref:hypothetical protein n=1 Tax=Cytobacillus kochii TaxID=859143 RepID=UPI001CD412A4|nr:hypothetical protein [Cytobacillus kochii]MCA1026285.1 hypothetical protein [Cytobacillus kochii]